MSYFCRNTKVVWKFCHQKFFKKYSWPRRDLNTQPSDLESDALPLRHGVSAIAHSALFCLPQQIVTRLYIVIYECPFRIILPPKDVNKTKTYLSIIWNNTIEMVLFVQLRKIFIEKGSDSGLNTSNCCGKRPHSLQCQWSLVYMFHSCLDQFVRSGGYGLSSSWIHVSLLPYPIPPLDLAFAQLLNRFILK